MQNEVVIEEKKASHFTILFSVVVIALIGIIYFQYKKTNTSITRVTEEEAQGAKDVLLGKSTFSPGTNTPMKVASENGLPSDITLLISANPTNLLIKQAIGENKKPVYRITFVANDSLASFHLKTVARARGSKQWEVMRSERASLFALIEAENKTHEARMSATYLSDSTTDVLIEIQSQ